MRGQASVEFNSAFRPEGIGSSAGEMASSVLVMRPASRKLSQSDKREISAGTIWPRASGNSQSASMAPNRSSRSGSLCAELYEQRDSLGSKCA